MDKEELKQKLLGTNYFIDNNYLEDYCNLIIINLDRSKEKYKTESHHILPQCYFKLINQSVNNSKENKVNLYYSDHLLVHYYLALCTIKNLKYRLSIAFSHLLGSNKRVLDFDIKEYLPKYQEIKECHSKGTSEYWKNISREKKEE